MVEVRSPRLSVYGQLQRRVGRVLFSSMPRWRSLRHSAPRTPLRAPRVLGGIAVNRPLRPAFWLCPRGTPPGQEGVYGWDVRLGAISRDLPQSPAISRDLKWSRGLGEAGLAVLAHLASRNPLGTQ